MQPDSDEETIQRLTFNPRPFQEALVAIHRRMHQLGIPH